MVQAFVPAGTLPGMTRRIRFAAIGLAAATTLTLSGCSVLGGSSDGAAAAATPTPQVSPSVWVSKGKEAAVAAATVRLIRPADLGPAWTSAPLTVSDSTKGIKPVACAALTGPALGMVQKSTGRASTSFTGKDGRTAIAQTVGVYPTVKAATGVLDRAVSLGRKCRAMTAFGQELTVRASRTTVGGRPAVVLTQRQKTAAESITVIVSEKFVSVVAIASVLPGPEEAVVQKTTTAAATRLVG